MASQRVSKNTLIAFRGESMVLLSGKFPRSFPFKSEDRQDGNPDGLLASIRSKLMLTCSTFCHCITNKPSQIPPILRIERDIAVSGGAL